MASYLGVEAGVVIKDGAICADAAPNGDFYGPHVTNQIIREALSPYPDDLALVTKIGGRRGDDALIDALAAQGIAYAPFFPLGGFSPLQSATLTDVASRLEATPMQTALAWLLQRAPNILLIPGTSSVAHLRENMAAGDLHLSPETIAELDGVAG